MSLLFCQTHDFDLANADFAAWVVLLESKVTRLERQREIHVLVKFIARSEEHTSELQSRRNLVCRLLLEKKKQKK